MKLDHLIKSALLGYADDVMSGAGLSPHVLSFRVLVWGTATTPRSTEGHQRPDHAQAVGVQPTDGDGDPVLRWLNGCVD